MNRIIYKINIIFVFFLLSVSVKGQTSDFERAIVRINSPSQIIIDTYYNSGNYEVWNYSPDNYLDIVLRKSEYENLIYQGNSIEIMQTETSIRENLILKQINVTKSTENNYGYYTYETLLNDLQQISNENSICQLIDIGDSRGKEYYNQGYQAYSDFSHDIWAIKVSDNVNVEEDEPNIYFIGLHHPAEIVSLEVVMKILYIL